MARRILLIDDDELTLAILQFTLRKLNFTGSLDTVSTGEQALAYFENLLRQTPDAAPDLILLDLFMPRMNGWEFLDIYTSRFEARYPDTRVCIITSSVDPADVDKATRYPCVSSFVEKPFGFQSESFLRNMDRLGAGSTTINPSSASGT
ncbi:response regulator [Telluribacter sp.]|jgi:CheY-like chemotaxis protein|uniref:response regulator n=1 Tax=Telluribacter sp. TaxID=1978767 RepID=UPI002E104B15|nr:response regulator [Telluribacter sp.]